MVDLVAMSAASLTAPPDTHRTAQDSVCATNPPSVKRKGGRPRVEIKNPDLIRMARRAYLATGSQVATSDVLGIAESTVKRLIASNPEDFAPVKLSLPIPTA